MLAKTEIETVPAKCVEYAERVKAGESMREVARDFIHDHGGDDQHLFRIGYYAHLLGADIECDFDWTEMAVGLFS